MEIRLFHHPDSKNSTKRENASIILQAAYDPRSSEETNLQNILTAFDFIAEELDLPRSTFIKFLKFPQIKDDWERSFFYLLLYLEGHSINLNGRYQKSKAELRRMYGY